MQVFKFDTQWIGYVLKKFKGNEQIYDILIVTALRAGYIWSWAGF